jgi:uncharacterized protein (DUF2147 family)
LAPPVSRARKPIRAAYGLRGWRESACELLRRLALRNPCGSQVARGSGHRPAHGPTKIIPDPALRRRPLVGLPVLWSLQPSGPGKWSGTLYNVENGNTYEGHLLDVGPRTIRIEGCAIGICGGRNLSRIQ